MFRQAPNIFAQLPKRWANETEQPHSPLFSRRRLAAYWAVSTNTNHYSRNLFKLLFPWQCKSLKVGKLGKGEIMKVLKFESESCDAETYDTQTWGDFSSQHF